MAKNRLVVNHIKDSIQLSWQRRQAVPRFAPPVPFKHPFDENALSELGGELFCFWRMIKWEIIFVA